MINDEFIQAWSQLDSVDKEIVKIKLSHPSITNGEIGKLLDPPISNVAVWKRIAKSSDIKKCLDLIDLDVIRSLQSLYPIAIANLRKLLFSKNENVVVDICKFILRKAAESDHMITESLKEETLEFVYKDIERIDHEKTDKEKTQEEITI